MKASFADILREVSGEGLKKVLAKVPSWSEAESLVIPGSLSTEQCSSEETAMTKARTVSELGCRRVADLTGGLGVDSWAFAGVCGEVLYNEMNPSLVDAARHNFAALGVDNVRFSNAETLPGSIAGILGDFRPDLIFLDPARRSGSGRKVFRLEDCSPDVLKLKEELLLAAPRVMMKLSPMADISLAAAELGNHVSDVIVSGSGGECKELLVLMDRKEHLEYRISVVEKGSVFSFLPSEEAAASPRPGVPSHKLLFEPGKALLKSGAFRLTGSLEGMYKAGSSTHLYFCDEIHPSLAGLGKWFSIDRVEILNNRTIREAGKLNPHCEVTARNLQMSSEQLRKKMGCASGGTAHIFAFRCDASGEKLLVTTTRIISV